MPAHRRIKADSHAAFLETWDWTRFMTTWREACGPLPDPLIVRVPLAAPLLFHSSRFVDPPTMHVWWAADEIFAKQCGLQLQLLRFSHDRPLLNELYCQRAGERTTAELLAHAPSPDACDALLIAAALHRYTNSRARQMPYLPQRVLWTITTWAWAAAGFQYSPWHHLSTQALPGDSDAFDTDDDLDDEGLARWDGTVISGALGAYHRKLLASWRPVELVIDAHGDPTLVDACREAQAREAQAREVQAREVQAREVQARQAAEHLQRHPRAKEWPPAADVLRTLVWSMPTVEVAGLFGVSDVAVAKRCTKLGIPKPPVGFWRKVEAGTIKHPNGQVPKERRAPKTR